jgi:F-type H+-transporting ATPase subunit epsilon
MPAELFNLEIHTPYRLFFIDKVEAITLTLEDGEAGIYANHSFMIAPIRTGILRIKDKDGLWKNAFTTEGILEVSGHRTVLLVDAAEWPDEIDRDRALAARKRAEEELKGGVIRFEAENARLDLKRAETRLKVYDLREKARPD